MTRMQINGSDTGTLRLFHLDLPPEAVERFTAQAGTGEWPLKYVLGATRLRPAFVEVVDIRDLGSMTLSQYLVEAHGVQGADFKAMRPQIDGLRGHVVVLPAQAFDNTSQELTIATPLRWIGTFGEVTAKRGGPKIRSASAQGVTGGSGAGAPGNPSPLLKYLLIGLGVIVLAVAGLALGVGG
ncbi:MAG: aspartate carbamoyltransferase catalytic subunit [Paracoccaceae bacterium]|nr:aspartate carbamoyltransferase catalytic subunit [Paracoccaceae bacterium]